MKKVIIINSEQFGVGSKELGDNLMGSFLRKLWMLDKKPQTIIFYNSGVKLLAHGSPVLDAVDALFTAEIDIVACGTCISYYQQDNTIAIGRVGNMQEIASILLEADNVITV